MTIRLKCPNAKCQKALVVKDEQAGKRLRCPACKQPVSVPAPRAEPADLEDFAAAALADDPAEKKAAESSAPKSAQTIDFTCYYCDAELHRPAEEGGKQIPCPECRKIIKVPALKVEKAKDWRDVEKKGPAFAKQDEPVKPAGAWDTKATMVGAGVLEEAGVIAEPEEPRTLKERLKPWVIVGGLVGLVVLLYVVSTNLMSRSAQRKALDEALSYVKGDKAKLPPLLAGEVFRAAGEFHLRADEAEKARQAFVSARDQCRKVDTKKGKDRASPLDRDLLLTEIAISQTGLGGSGEQVLGGDARERLEWGEAGDEIYHTLKAIGSSEAQAIALAEVCRRLLESRQPDVALGVANRLKMNVAAPPPPDKGENPEAPEVPAAPPVPPGDFARAQLAALLLATDKAVPVGLLPEDDKLYRLAQAHGKALKGEFEQAHKEAMKAGTPKDKLRALLMVAAVTIGKGKAADAKPSLSEALKIEEKFRKAKMSDPVLTLQLARLGARAGVIDKSFADGIPDKAARARAQLELFLLELARGRDTAEPKLVDEAVKDKETLAFALGQEAVARHDARLGQHADVLGYVSSLEERFRPFAQIGIALGIQDRKQP
jgi:hypothetical protein